MCSFRSCQTRFEFLSQFRKVRNAFECFITQVQTRLPKTKCVWPMKINVICTVLAVMHVPMYLRIGHSSACLLCTYVLTVMHDARVVVRDFIVVLYLGGVPLEVILRSPDDVLSQYTDVATPVRPRLLMVESNSVPQLVHDHTFLDNEITWIRHHNIVTRFEI